MVGEIAAGILLGKSGFNLVQSTPTLEFLAQFDFVFLVFLSGLEVSFESLLAVAANQDAGRPRWPRPRPRGLLVFGGPVRLGVGAGLGLTGPSRVQDPLLRGLILSTTSWGLWGRC